MILRAAGDAQLNPAVAGSRISTAPGAHEPFASGAPGDLDFGKIVVDAEAVAEAEAEGAFAGAAGGEEGAVDVEEEEFFVRGHGRTRWQRMRRVSPPRHGARLPLSPAP